MSTYLRSVAALNYADPVPVLIRYRELEVQVATADVPDNVRTLRTAGLKSAREGREAALFAVGLAEVLETKVWVALDEGADYDFVLRWSVDDTVQYCPVQLKELVSEERNALASLSGLLEGLRVRPKSNTVLLVRLNRREDVDLRGLPLKGLPYCELWFLWQSSPTHWSIWGDALMTGNRTDFEYPVGRSARGTV